MSSAVYTTLAFLLVSCLVSAVGGLLCYECTSRYQADGDEPSNINCIIAPWKITGSVKTCLPHLKACKTVRTEHKDTGRIKLFVRSCSSTGKDSETTNQDYRIIHRYCTTNKCNVGDGKVSGADGQKRRLTAILVKDVKDAGHRIHAVSLLLMLSFFLPLTLTLH